MDDNERVELADDLERHAAAVEYDRPYTARIMCQAAARIRADGHRMKAMYKMAVTLNEEMEEAVRRHLEDC